MKKKPNFILTAGIIISTVLLVFCILRIINLQSEIESIEASNVQLNDKNKQLELMLAKAQQELALRDEENAELKESLSEETDGTEKGLDISEVQIIENEPIIAYSPDEKYCAEAFGTMIGAMSGGQYAYNTIHVSNVHTGEIIWGMQPAGFTVEFIWSADSRYLSVYSTARYWGESIIVDVFDDKRYRLPKAEVIAAYYDEALQPQEDRPDPYFRIVAFENAETVLVEFKWFDMNGDIVEGKFSYNFMTNDIILK